MDYLECNFGPSCTCDHRSTLVHGTTPSFSSPDSRGCDVMTRSSSSYSKKEHSDSIMIPKRARSEGLSSNCLYIRTYLNRARTVDNLPGFLPIGKVRMKTTCNLPSTKSLFVFLSVLECKIILSFKLRLSNKDLVILVHLGFTIHNPKGWK